MRRVAAALPFSGCTMRSGVDSGPAMIVQPVEQELLEAPEIVLEQLQLNVADFHTEGLYAGVLN